MSQRESLMQIIQDISPKRSPFIPQWYPRFVRFRGQSMRRRRMAAAKAIWFRLTATLVSREDGEE